MAWGLCSSYAIITKAGLGANSTAVASEALLELFYNQAEAQFNARTRKDWTTIYGGIGTYFKEAIGDAVSDLGAMKVILYDMGGYTSRLEATTILDALKTNSDKIIDDLVKQEYQKTLGA